MNDNSIFLLLFIFLHFSLHFQVGLMQENRRDEH